MECNDNLCSAVHGRRLPARILGLLFIFCMHFSYAQFIPQDTINAVIKPPPRDSIFGPTDTVRKFPTDSLIKYQDGLFRSSFEQNRGTVTPDSIQKAQSFPKNKRGKIDTTRYSPKKAALWALACPGLGQIYMKKYWKLPIVYGLMGTVIYFVASNAIKLKEFNGYIRNVYDSVPNPAPFDQLDLSQIEQSRNVYRRNVQISSFGTMFVWGLSIVDAVVDAHLHSFEVSDNLSMKVKPQINTFDNSYYTGIAVNLTFK